MFCKKGVLRIAQNSKENTCARVSFLIKLQACLRPATFFKKRLLHRCFPVNFAKFPRTPFSKNTSRLLLPKWTIIIKVKPRSNQYQSSRCVSYRTQLFDLYCMKWLVSTWNLTLGWNGFKTSFFHYWLLDINALVTKKSYQVFAGNIISPTEICRYHLTEYVICC